MDAYDLKYRFESEARSLIARDGIENLLKWLHMTDFYTAPASTKYHGAIEGGLVQHSLTVYDELFSLCNHYHYFSTDTANRRESAAIVSLFHDICKADMYNVAYRNMKDDKGEWYKTPYYTVDEAIPYGGHGAKSVYLVQRFIPLKAEEAIAIYNHMGAWDKSAYGDPGKAYAKYPLAWLLHIADEAATYLDNM